MASLVQRVAVARPSGCTRRGDVRRSVRCNANMQTSTTTDKIKPDWCDTAAPPRQSILATGEVRVPARVSEQVRIQSKSAGFGPTITTRGALGGLAERPAGTRKGPER